MNITRAYETKRPANSKEAYYYILQQMVVIWWIVNSDFNKCPWNKKCQPTPESILLNPTTNDIICCGIVNSAIQNQNYGYKYWYKCEVPAIIANKTLMPEWGDLKTFWNCPIELLHRVSHNSKPQIVTWIHFTWLENMYEIILFHLTDWKLCCYHIKRT